MLAFIFDVLQFVVRSYVAELRFMWCVNGLCVYPHAQGKLSKVGGSHYPRDISGGGVDFILRSVITLHSRS